MTECPLCGCEFKNEQGVKSHASQKHGENPFSVVIECECEYCGSAITKYPSVKDQAEMDFCNKECHRRWQSECKPKEEHNWWEGGKETVQCSYCGKRQKRKPAIVEANNWFFCSTDCESSFKSEKITREKHPRWKGGHNHDYGPNWNKQREKRLEKDGYECVVCGMSNGQHREEHNCGLHVHHIERKDSFRTDDGDLDYERANRLENLITLCYKCHGRWEGIPLRPELE
jgi:5-methylcytosine-specific restriction endonuclease McrA